MQHEFEYSAVQTYLGRYTVEDISDVCLKMTNGLDKEWYMCISTELGETQIFTFGPVEQIDNKFLILPGFNFKYDKIGYSEKKLITKIDKVLNNGEITDVEEIDTDEFLHFREGWKDAKYY